MAKPAGKCVWCGGTGLTKGHIWPNWFGKVLHLNATQHVESLGDIRTFTPTYARHPFSQKVRHGHAASRKHRNTCVACNGGWMSQIESAAKPDAVPVFLGQCVRLAPAAQERLAALLCLITMRVEFADMATAATRPIERTWLMETSKPPDNWRIWIARYAGRDAGQHWCRHHGIQIVSTPDEGVGPYLCNTQVTTLVFGELCAHVFSSSVWEDFAGYDGVRLIRLWPLSGFDIETRFFSNLSDAAVLNLSEALVRDTPPIPATT